MNTSKNNDQNGKEIKIRPWTKEDKDNPRTEIKVYLK